jgi:hypothetical protein
MIVRTRVLELEAENSPDSLGELNTRMHEWLKPNIGSVGESVRERGVAGY